MGSTLMQMPIEAPATGLSSYVALAQSITAPKTAVHGTGLPFAGTSVATTAAGANVLAGAATAAVAGVRSTDLPGPPPRGAPV